MKRLLIVLLLLLTGLSATAADAPRAPSNHAAIEPGKKVALVIGNSAYRHATTLPNPVNDATAIAAALGRMNFKVIFEADVTRAGLKDAIRRLRGLAFGAEKAVFFYAGHGLEVDGINYLVPVDAPEIADKRDLKDAMVLVSDVLEEIEPARAKVAFLDACRNNPLGRSLAVGRTVSVGRGLAPMDAPRGTLIAYATKHGAIADDGDGKHSPYTQALLENLEKPGLELRQILDQTRAKVLAATRDKQLPYEYSSLTGAFYFFGGPVTVNVQPQQMDPAAIELSFWESVKGSNSAEEYQAYLEQYPKGRFSGIARARVKALAVAPLTAVYPHDGAGLVVVAPPPVTPPTAVVVPQPPLQAQYRDLQVFHDCADCPEMMVIPAGRFQMGSNDYGSVKPLLLVTIGKPFALGKTEVTQAQWKAVMGSAPPKLHFKDCGGDCPVENVSWNDTQEFIRKLNAKTGKLYRLPSEAEWEYACRAGDSHTYCGGNDLDTVAWYDKNSGGKTHSVAGKQANAFGLRDMSGNVWEWVEDCWNKDYEGAPKDGSDWTNGDCGGRVLRGGSWVSTPISLRAASRHYFHAGYSFNDYGFRVARALP